MLKVVDFTCSSQYRKQLHIGRNSTDRSLGNIILITLKEISNSKSLSTVKGFNEPNMCPLGSGQWALHPDLGYNTTSQRGITTQFPSPIGYLLFVNITKFLKHSWLIKYRYRRRELLGPWLIRITHHQIL